MTTSSPRAELILSYRATHDGYRDVEIRANDEVISYDAGPCNRQLMVRSFVCSIRIQKPRAVTVVPEGGRPVSLHPQTVKEIIEERIGADDLIVE